MERDVGAVSSSESPSESPPESLPAPGAMVERLLPEGVGDSDGGFRLVRLLFSVRFEERTMLDEFKGPSLRGRLGYALKSVVCSRPSGAAQRGSCVEEPSPGHREVWGGSAEDSCVGCPQWRTCLYHGCYERPGSEADARSDAEFGPGARNPLSAAERVGSRSDEIVRPFVLDPPVTPQEEFEAGTPLQFGITILGNAVDSAGRFLEAARLAGLQGGWGRGRQGGRFAIEDVETVACDGSRRPATFSFDGRAVGASVRSSGICDAWPGRGFDAARIEFLTPTLLMRPRLSDASRGKARPELVENPSFEDIALRLWTRIRACGRSEAARPADPTSAADRAGVQSSACRNVPGKLKDAAAKIESAGSIARTARYHTGSVRRGDLDRRAIQGSFEFRGDLDPFVPLLVLGSWVHVGKHPTMGAGMYRLTLGYDAGRGSNGHRG